MVISGFAGGVRVMTWDLHGNLHCVLVVNCAFLNQALFDHVKVCPMPVLALRNWKKPRKKKKKEKIKKKIMGPNFLADSVLLRLV